MLAAPLFPPRSKALPYRSALLTLACGIALSALLAAWLAQRLDAQEAARFQQLAQRQQARLQQHFERYGLGLRGLRGLFLDNDESVNPEQLRRYVDSRELPMEFPGSRSWGYVERLPAADVARHLRQRHGLAYRPLPGVVPATGGDAYVLRLAEPVTADLPPRGSDLGALPALRTGLWDAMQSGQPTLTAPVRPTPDATPVLFMLLPVYQGVHTAGNVAGWTITSLDRDGAFRFLGDEPGLAQRLDIVVRDTGANQELYRLPADTVPLSPLRTASLRPPRILRYTSQLDLNGRRWEVAYQARPGFYGPATLWLPPLAFGTGSVLSLLAAAVLLLRSRLQDEVAARTAALTVSLREQQALLRSTLASLQDWVFVLDERGQVLDAHEAPGQGWLIGSDCIGKSLRSLLPAPAAAVLDARLSDAAAQGQAEFDFEVPGTLQSRRFSARLCRRHDAGGRPDGFTLLARDVSGERQRLQALQLAEEKFRLVFMESAQANILISQQRYLDANPAALALLGVPNLTALQHSSLGLLSPLMQPDGRPSATVAQELMGRLQAESPLHFEWTFQRITGSESFPAEVSASALRINGETCFLFTINDLSAHKQTESSLRQARDAAEAATREKSEFLATMSHEIRTPMNGVLGMAQLLSNTALNPEQRDYLATIQHSGQSLLTIINDILDFSKIEAGKLSFEEVPFDLQIAVEETCELLLPQMREKHLALTLRLDPATPFHVIGDPGRFRQILLNYLSNALKFTPQGGITVALRARESGRGAALFELSVADTGIGIEPSKQNLLFQKFAQADASTTRRFGGTGLGLAICKALVERMGGDVSMSSTPGQGSVFRATFWMSLDPQAGQQPLPIILPALRNAPVLVIETNTTLRQQLVDGLNRTGLNATGANGVSEALATAHPAPPRFILMEAEPGDTDTASLIDALRARGLLQDATLLLLSSRPDRNDHAFCREHGVAAFLPRPARLAWVLSSLNILANGEHDGVVTRQTLAMHLARGKALPALRNGIRVLLAEDNAVNQKVAARMLEKMGCHVDMAGNGLEALVMVSQLPYDLVLMDVQMPEMDGITAARSLRAQGFTGLPVIALTANNRESDRQECRAAGMNDFLAKPIRYEDLHACLSRWVQTTRQPA